MNLLQEESFPGLIIAGFHRSGTSALAGLLHKAGMHLGDRLVLPHDSNEGGHFEDLDAVRFHDCILERQGQNWQYSSTTPPSMDGLDWLALYRYTKARQSAGQAWVVKDPRLPLFADAWRRVLPDAAWVLVYRHPAECHDSLARRHSRALLLGKGDRETGLRFWKEPDLAWRMWLSYHRILLSALEKVTSPVLVLSHQAFMDDRANKALAQLSTIVREDVSRHAKHLRPEWSQSSTCQPPLDDKLVAEVEATWRQLARYAGDLADLRESCVQPDAESYAAEVTDDTWEILRDNLSQFSQVVKSTAPVATSDVSSFPLMQFEGPKDALTQAELAIDLHQRQDLLFTAVQQYPSNFWIHRALGLCLWERGDSNEARACLERAAALEPERLVIWRELARLAVSQNMLNEALTYLAHAWPLAATHSDMLAELSLLAAQIYVQLKDNNLARIHAENAVVLRPGWLPAHIFLDRLCGIDNPLGYLEKLVSAYHSGERDAGCVLPLTFCLLQSGRAGEAREVIDGFLAGEPGHRSAREALASVLRVQEKNEDARSLERKLSQEILAEPGCSERILGLKEGLDIWARIDLRARLEQHIEKISSR